jgi:MFS family permease
MIVGVLGAGRLVTAWGRQRTLLLTAIGSTILAAVSPAVAHLVWLDATRFVLGAGVGVAIVVAPVFIAEAAPIAARGRIAVLYQVATVGGIVGAYLTAYGLASGGRWRLMLGVSAVLSAVVAGLLARVPETPNGLVVRRERAARTEAGRRAPRTLSVLFGARYRSVTFFLVVLGALVQLTGVSAVGNFGPRIFEGMGYRGPFSLLVLPAVVQLSGLLAALCSSFAVDRLGRRATLLSGTAVMVVGHALLVAAFAKGSTGGWGAALGLAGLLLFTMGFNAGLGSLIWIYAAEGYTDRLRSAGVSALLLPNLAANFLLAQFFLEALTSLGGTVTFALLLCVAVLGWLFIFVRAPETRHRSLDEIHAYWQNGRRWPIPEGER